MLRTFSRLNPNAGALSRPYRAYQTLVAQQWDDTWPVPPNEKLPAEVRHIHRASPLKSWNDTPERRKPREVLDRFFDDERILSAAGSLALELEDRARWLAERGTTITDENSASRQGRQHRLEAIVPLAVAGGFADVNAKIGLYSDAHLAPGKRKAVPHLGYLSVELSGTNTALDERFWTYASIDGYMLDQAHPETVGFTPHSVYGPSLISGFELRDMLTFVENNAPDSGLPQQRYPSHVMHDLAATAEPAAI